MCVHMSEGVCLSVCVCQTHQCSPHLLTREQFIDVINGIEVSLIQRVVAREHLEEEIISYTCTLKIHATIFNYNL